MPSVDNKRPLKVFLCHAHADRDAVRALYTRLTNDGVDAWLDKVKLLPGQDWELEIKKAVREADVVVVCLSKQFNQAGFRQKEVRLALDTAMEKPEGEIFIIPARLEECETLESLRKWHWVDLFEGDGYERLMRALRARADKIGATLQVKRDRLSILPSPTQPIVFNVAPLGAINLTEIDNAISLTNKIQTAFHFKFYPEIISIKDDKFLLSNGALDLDKAVKNLLKRKSINKLVSNKLILITSKPYSNHDALNQYAGKNLELIQQCYFYDTESAKNVALISSYIWDHLPKRRGFPATLSGQRALEPFLVSAFAVIALDRCIGEIHHHEAIRGCPSDYCENVRDIDRFFLKGRFCDDCENVLKKNVQEGNITTAQVNSIKKILKVAQ